MRTLSARTLVSAPCRTLVRGRCALLRRRLCSSGAHTTSARRHRREKKTAEASLAVQDTRYLSLGLLAVGRHNTGEKHRHDAVRRAVPQNLEHDVLTGFELGNSLAIIVDRGDGLTVQFGDDVARGELNVVGKASGLDFADKHAFLTLDPNMLGF